MPAYRSEVGSGPAAMEGPAGEVEGEPEPP